MDSSNALCHKNIHFIGIGGTGLSAIAQVLLERGAKVSGSDRVESTVTASLVRQGAVVYVGHAAEHVEGADVVVVSSAIPENNPEIRAARERRIPVLKRSEFIGELLEGYFTIAVAGTHGKTTTTAMIAFILSEAEFSPSFIIGGMARNLGTNAKAGQGSHFVVEADEYDHMFWGLTPEVAVVTNLEMDHPDCFGCLEDVIEAFVTFLRRVPADGHIILNGDDRRLQELSAEIELPGLVTFGRGANADWRAVDIVCQEAGGSEFLVSRGGTVIGQFELRIPGVHNVLNALAAIAATSEVGVRLSTIRESLSRFEGTERRFEHKGTVRGVTVIDDYAHHPTEIRATLAAARAHYAGRKVWAVFQPHTYSRFKALLQEFSQSFELADHVIVTDIFASRERDSLGAHASDMIALMSHHDVRYVADSGEIVLILAENMRPGDVCITLGAGDCHLLGERLLDKLRSAPYLEC
jgi:UDP-N-acetylmuramate--alanine ligase